MAIFDAHPRDRLQVFIDGQNLFGTLRAIEKKMDYKAFIEVLREETRLIRVQYFTTVRPQQFNDERFNSVLDMLDFNGYEVRTKDVRDNVDPNGNIRTKGTIIGDMTAAMVEAAYGGTDHIVLFSGDSELLAAVETCKRNDCRVTVVSSEAMHVVAEELRRACDHFIKIENLPSSVIVNDTRSFRQAA